ncbi:MAG: hypothetical protein GY833_02570, partial [Aestuariibacter sp.]|nr:hypothetical protein [Aestuariibacter sp.]
GNDSLTGYYGDDVYKFNLGDGQDVIYGENSSYSNQYGIDKIVFGEGITELDVELKPNGYHLIIDIIGTEDQITLYEYFSSDSLSDGFAVKSLEFADGATLDLTTGLELIGSENADNIKGTSGNDTLMGLGGDDTINGNNGDDVIYGGEGNDSLTGYYGDDVIYGGEGNDYINGNNGDDVIYGGEGNDSLTGYYGDDVYKFNLGDGQDVIYGENSSYSNQYGIDKIVFGEG